MKIDFVENKELNPQAILDCLAISRQANRWTNFGPVIDLLARSYEEHMNVVPGSQITACSSGGVALEALARTLCEQESRSIKWAASSFTFRNIGRGYFSNALICDCDNNGLLDLDALSALAPGAYDGFIVTNPLGMCADFSRYIDFAKAHNKHMLIDNASGISRNVPAWPWQSFSLHHTKAHGMGEGGLALSPVDASETLKSIINYGAPPQDARNWFTNGKLSDISAAFHLVRLQALAEWEPRYLEQRERLAELALRFDLHPLSPIKDVTVTNSLPLRFPQPVAHALTEKNAIPVGRYYEPIEPTTQALSLFERLLSFPCHSGLAKVSDQEINQTLEFWLSATGSEK